MSDLRDTDVTHHYRACHLCEAICGIEIRHRDGDILSIRGDKKDPLSRGHICPKAVALIDVHTDPDRLTRPRLRDGDRWVELDWPEAFEIAAARLVAIRERHDNDAIATYQGNPSVHNYGLLTHAGHLFGHLKTRNRFSATSVDQLPHQLVALWMYGHQFLIPVPDIDRSEFILMLGANPITSNGSLWTVPDVRTRIRQLRARGGRLVVIDPRRSETAAEADEHHFVRPGSDAALLLAMLHVLYRDGLVNPGPLESALDGVAEVGRAVSAFTPELAARATGIDATTIVRLTGELAAAGAASCYGRMGVSTQRHGALCQWAIQMINILTGNLDRPGGAMLTLPPWDLVGAPATRPGSHGRWHSRVRGLPESNGELPVAVLAEEIMTPGEGQIRALVSVAGNPVLSTPNGGQLDAALSQLEFMLSIDPYLNETTRHAHLILPPASPLCGDHFDMTFDIFAVRNTAKYSAPMLPKPEGSLHDWEILAGVGSAVARLLGRDAKPDVRPEDIAEQAIRYGPYGEASGHAAALTLDKLKANPHGIDLGPLGAQLPARLHTPDKRIHCAPAQIIEELKHVAAEFADPDAGSGLRLIGRRHVRSNNSWMHNYHRLVKGPERCVLLMHPDDLQRRRLNDGERVTVRSRVGEIETKVRASDDMMPGVVSLPHGFGHDRQGTLLSIAGRHAGASVNDLTDELLLDRLSGNAALNGVPVEVVAAI